MSDVRVVNDGGNVGAVVDILQGLANGNWSVYITRTDGPQVLGEVIDILGDDVIIGEAGDDGEPVGRELTVAVRSITEIVIP
jgi:hypothetical protein